MMQVTSPTAVGGTLTALLGHSIAGPPTADAVGYLDELFARRGRPGIQMATRALRLGIPEEGVEAICVAYMTALAGALGCTKAGRNRSTSGQGVQQLLGHKLLFDPAAGLTHGVGQSGVPACRRS